MILADKIVRLRKKNGWSQEELAERMQVSRQAVSKWEAAQSTPDLAKLLELGRLFGVTTDYLLKDELEDEQFSGEDEAGAVRRFSLAQANQYLALRARAAKRIAGAVMLCMLSVIPLLLLAAASECTDLPVPQTAAVGIGVVAILPPVAAAVVILLRVGFANAPYAFLEQGDFTCEYGVTGMVRERQKAYRPRYIRQNCVGVVACVLSPVPVLCGAFTEKEFLCVAMLCLTIVLAGIGVMHFIYAGVRSESMNRILREGEHAQRAKRKSKLAETVQSVYWLVTVAVYLAWSFLSGDWHITWVVWPVAAVLSGAVELVCAHITERKER